MSRFKTKREDFPYFSDGTDVLDGVNVEEIVPGCAKPDCIPSIDKPIWIDISHSEFPRDEVILGMIYGEEQFAVPMTILDYHEVVNFQSAKGDPLAITYCPLCQTATAYKRILDGREIVLGVSGLLLNSALVLFDRRTNSLFSQVWSKGIVGDYNGIKLDQRPIIQSTIEDWSITYPESKILSKNTGFPDRAKRYGIYPYRDYKEHDRLAFPVSTQDEKLFSKELVFAIEMKETYIIAAKSLSGAIQHTEEFYSIPLAGGRVFFSGNIEDGINWERWIPSGISFYFASRAYFPHAVILQ